MTLHGVRTVFGRIWAGVVTQQRVRSNFWKDLGRSYYAAGGEKQFLIFLGCSCDAAWGEKQLLEGFGKEFWRNRG